MHSIVEDPGEVEEEGEDEKSDGESEEPVEVVELRDAETEVEREDCNVDEPEEPVQVLRDVLAKLEDLGILNAKDSLNLSPSL